MEYGYRKQVGNSFDDLLERVKQELKKEGFGIITEVDVKKTFKEKLEIDYDEYVILGACNPQSAHKALETEKEAGLLLPCNVIVYEKDSTMFVSAILPTKAMSIVDNDKLIEIAQMIEKKLKKAINRI